MGRWFEPELNNNFDFIFNKIEDGDIVWYKAVVYVDEYAFAHIKSGIRNDYNYYTRYLKPNYHHEIIGKVYVLEDYIEDDFWIDNLGEETEWSLHNQTIEFNTNEHGEIDLENVEFYDY